MVSDRNFQDPWSWYLGQDFYCFIRDRFRFWVMGSF